jgi:hypothetical protein
MLLRNHANAAAFLAPVILLLSLCVADLRSEEIGDERYRSHEVGIAAGIFKNSFIDDVISPVIYTDSSPVFELFYRCVKEGGRAVLSLKYVSYTARMRDGIPGDHFELLYSDGDTYSLPRSMHEMDGSRFELNLGGLIRLASFQDGKAAFYLGGNMLYFFEKMKSYDYWSESMGWWKDKSELSGFSIVMTGKLERRIRRIDRLSVDLNFSLASLVDRLPYYSPLARIEDLDQNSNAGSNTFGMLFYDYLNWSAQLSYMFWFGEALGLEACYRFQHQRVTEPRHLRYVSHTMSLGVVYAIKGKQ